MKYVVVIGFGGTWYLDEDREICTEKHAFRLPSRDAAEKFRQKWAGGNTVCLQRSTIQEV